ncbi:MAG: hypothetical protein K1X56_08790 [Flavobacteriales bacterium]|nr:hypothetical protein [Flavobacteriales bacterium]
MKKPLCITILGLLPLFTSFTSQAQTPVIGTPPANNPNAQAGAAWYRGGNNNTVPLGNNIFGTLWNSPIYTFTANTPRSKLNGNLVGAQYLINGFGTIQGVNTSGYMLLGNDLGITPNNFYNQKGAFSMLHLNGNTNNPGFIQEQGYRTWMRTGITFTDNQDRAYIGYRANALDVSDFIVNWSDNSVGGVGAPDNMIFNFLS